MTLRDPFSILDSLDDAEDRNDDPLSLLDSLPDVEFPSAIPQPAPQKPRSMTDAVSALPESTAAPFSPRTTTRPTEASEIADAFTSGLARGAAGVGESFGTVAGAVGKATGWENLENMGRLGEDYFGEIARQYKPPAEIEGKNVWDDPDLLTSGVWWASTLGEGIPSLAATMLPAAGVGTAVRVGGTALKWSPVLVARLARIGQAVAGGSVGGSLEGASTYKETLERGGTEAEALAAGTMMGLAAAGLNAVSADRLLKAFPQEGARKKVIDFLSRGATEGLTEALEEPSEAAIYTAIGKERDDEWQEAFKRALTVLPSATVLGALAGGAAGVAQESEGGPDLTISDERIQYPSEEARRQAQQNRLGDAIADPDIEQRAQDIVDNLFGEENAGESDAAVAEEVAPEQVVEEETAVTAEPERGPILDRLEQAGIEPDEIVGMSRGEQRETYEVLRLFDEGSTDYFDAADRLFERTGLRHNPIEGDFSPLQLRETQPADRQEFDRIVQERFGAGQEQAQERPQRPATERVGDVVEVGGRPAEIVADEGDGEFRIRFRDSGQEETTRFSELPIERRQAPADPAEAASAPSAATDGQGVTESVRRPPLQMESQQEPARPAPKPQQTGMDLGDQRVLPGAIARGEKDMEGTPMGNAVEERKAAEARAEAPQGDLLEDMPQSSLADRMEPAEGRPEKGTYMGGLYEGGGAMKKGSKYIGGIYKVGDNQYAVYNVENGKITSRLPGTFTRTEFEGAGSTRISANQTDRYYNLKPEVLAALPGAETVTEPSAPEQAAPATQEDFISQAHSRWEEMAREDARKTREWNDEVRRSDPNAAATSVEEQRLPEALSVSKGLDYMRIAWPDAIKALGGIGKTRQALKDAFDAGALQFESSRSFRVDASRGDRGSFASEGSANVSYDRFTRESLDEWAAGAVMSMPAEKAKPKPKTPARTTPHAVLRGMLSQEAIDRIASNLPQESGKAGQKTRRRMKELGGGEYDVEVALQEAMADPAKAAVLEQAGIRSTDDVVNAIRTGSFYETYPTSVQDEAQRLEQERGQRMEDAVAAGEIDAPQVPVDDDIPFDIPASPDSFADQIQSAFNVSRDEAEATADLVDAQATVWAKQTGRTKEEYYETRFAEIRRETESEGGDLYQSASTAGATETELNQSQSDTPLIAVHGTTAEGIRDMADLGALPSPSLAITTPDKVTDALRYGDITLIGNRQMVDPEVSGNKTYPADAFTRRQPRREYRLKDREMQALSERMSNDGPWKAPWAALNDLEQMDLDRGLDRAIYDALNANGEAGQNLRLWFLKENGVEVTVPTKARKARSRVPFNPKATEVRKYIRSKKGDVPTNVAFGSEEHRELSDLAASLIDDTAQRMGEDAVDVADLRQMLAGDLFNDDGLLAFSQTDRFAEDIRSIANRARETDTDAYEKRIARAVKKAGGDEALEKWVRDTFTPILGETFFTTESGQKKPYLLQDIVAEMTRRGTSGKEGGMVYGLGQSRAAAAKPFRSVEEMREQADGIVDKEQVDKATEELKEAKFFPLADNLRSHYEWAAPDAFSFDRLDDASKAMGDYLKNGPKGIAGARRALSKNGYKGVPEGLLEEFVGVANELEQSPTAYFEAKPQRAVSLGEFEGAVVPRGTDEDVLQILRDNGVNRIYTYKKGDQEDRAKKVQRFRSALFQQAGKPQASVEFLEDGRAFIRAFEGGDVSSAVHEVIHVWRRSLYRTLNEALPEYRDQIESDINTLEKWAGVKDGRWTRKQEEKFARAGERYLREGRAPNANLARVFARFKEWLKGIYKTIKGSPIDVKLTKPVREVFDRMLDPEQVQDLSAVEAAEVAAAAVPSGPGMAYGMPMDEAPSVYTPASKQVRQGKLSTNKPKIIEALKDVLVAAGAEMPVRVGRFNQKALGIFKVNEEVIRLLRANDVPVAAHEVAHALEKVIYGKGDTWTSPWVDAGMQRELTILGRELYGRKKPAGGYKSEGWAQFVRFWLTGEQDMAKKAPKTSAWFQDTFLQQQPDVKKALGKAQKQIRDYYGATPRQRVGAQIARKSLKDKAAGLPRAAAKARRKLTYNWLEMGTELDYLSRAYQEKTGNVLSAAKDPYKLFSSFRGIHGRVVRYMVEDGMLDIAGNKVGSSLEEAAALVKGQHEAFDEYLLARRAVALLTDPKGPRNPGVTLEDAQATIEELETPEFAMAAQKVYEWNDGILNYAAGASPAFAQVVEQFRQRDPGDYVPLNRDMGDEGGITGTGRGGTHGVPQKRLKGSDRQVFGPTGSLIRNADKFVKAAHKRMVLDSVLKMSQVEGMGGLVEKIPRDQEPKQFQVDHRELLAEIEKQTGMDLSGLEESERQMISLTFFEPMTVPGMGENIIPVQNAEGKVDWYEVDPGLYETLQGMDVYQLPKAVDLVLGAPARWMRAGTTGLRASFSLVTNPLRDAQTLMVNSKANANGAKMFGLWAASMKDALASRAGVKTEWWDTFTRLGVEMAQPLSQDTNQTDRAARRIFGKKNVLDFGSNGMDLYRDLIQFPESAPRLAEMKEVAKEVGWTPGEPMTLEQAVQIRLAGKQVTTDFTAAGDIARKVNRVVPFHNAAIQGPRVTLRRLKENPGHVLLRGVAALTIPTLYAWLENKDEEWYQELPYRDLFMYWHILADPDDPNSDVIRIPRAFESGAIFAALPEAFLNAWYAQEPEMAEQYVNHLLEVTVPPVLPNVVEEAVEQAANYDYFWEQPIVSRSEQNMPAEEQFNEYTTRAAIEIGKATGLSPKRIDHAARAIFGGVGGDLMAAFGRGPEGTTGDTREEESSDLPVIGRLFMRGGRAGSRTRSVDRLYQLAEEAQIQSNSRRSPETAEQRQRRLMLEDATRAVTLLSRVRSGLDAEEARQGMTREIRDLAQDALARAERTVTEEDREVLSVAKRDAEGRYAMTDTENMELDDRRLWVARFRGQEQAYRRLGKLDLAEEVKARADALVEEMGGDEAFRRALTPKDRRNLSKGITTWRNKTLNEQRIGSPPGMSSAVAEVARAY